MHARGAHPVGNLSRRFDGPDVHRQTPRCRSGRRLLPRRSGTVRSAGPRPSVAERAPWRPCSSASWWASRWPAASRTTRRSASPPRWPCSPPTPSPPRPTPPRRSSSSCWRRRRSRRRTTTWCRWRSSRWSCWPSWPRRYRQTIHAYPDGGGAYVVSRENISQNAALVAGASLLVDYTLTVAVSVSSGVLAIGSAFHFNDNDRAARRPGPVLRGPDGPRQPARPQGGRPGLRRPHLRLHGAASALLIGYGIYRIGSSDLGTDPRQRASWPTSSPRSTAPTSKLTGSVGLLRPAAGLLLGRRGARRRRGHLQRRARLPQARVEERRADADDDGGHPRHRRPSASLPGQPPPPGVRRGRRDRPLPDGRGDLRRRDARSTTPSSSPPSPS